jgi:hypothetical protein
MIEQYERLLARLEVRMLLDRHCITQLVQSTSSAKAFPVLQHFRPDTTIN